MNSCNDLVTTSSQMAEARADEAHQCVTYTEYGLLRCMAIHKEAYPAAGNETNTMPTLNRHPTHRSSQLRGSHACSPCSSVHQFHACGQVPHKRCRFPHQSRRQTWAQFQNNADVSDVLLYAEAAPAYAYGRLCQWAALQVTKTHMASVVEK